MKIAIVGSGNIGHALGAAWVRAGHSVTFGSRDPGKPTNITGTVVTNISAALASAEVVTLAVPATAIPELVQEHGGALAAKPVIDTSVRFNGGPLNSCQQLTEVNARYIRSFSTLGWEFLVDPAIEGTVADQFFTACDDSTREIAEQLISDIGLRPIYVGGNDTVDVVDGVTRLWFALAVKRGLGRRLAVRLLNDRH